MLNEHDVRTMIDVVRGSTESPRVKVRKLMSICRYLRKMGAKITQGVLILEGEDERAAERLNSTRERVSSLRRMVKTAAWSVLRGDSSGSWSTGVPGAYPSWSGR